MQEERAPSPPKVCPNCSGYGLLFKTMHYPAATHDSALNEKPAIYFPERHVSTVSVETLMLWRENLKKEISHFEGKIKELQGGVQQTTQELLRREDSRKVAQ